MRAVRTTDIRKHFDTAGGPVEVLHGIDLAIDVGEFVAVIGPSGSGKSTLMNILGLLDAPSSGAYALFGEDTVALSEAERAALRNKALGFVFQSYNLLPRLSLADNVALPLEYAGLPRAQAVERACAELARLGLARHEDALPAYVSGGQQQRAAIARALVTRPALVLADEPTGNLDTRTAADVVATLRELNRAGTTVVLITHSPEVAAHAHRTLRIVDGLIVADERRMAATELAA